MRLLSSPSAGSTGILRFRGNGMPVRRTIWLAGILLLAGSAHPLPLFAQQAPQQPLSNLPGIVPSRDRTFRVPFSIEPGSRQRTKEVRLYLSQDNGMTWTNSGRVPPTEEFFQFFARNDGEYWFTVQTIDSNNRATPPTVEGSIPQLRVLVDTTPPVVQMTASPFPGNQVIVEWNVSDVNLDLGSLRLEFRGGAQPNWYPIVAQPSASGRTSFQTGMPGTVEIRLRVLDKAQNEGVKEITLGAQGAGMNNSQNYSGSPQGNTNDNNGFSVPARPNLNPQDNWNSPARNAFGQQNQNQSPNQAQYQSPGQNRGQVPDFQEMNREINTVVPRGSSRANNNAPPQSRAPSDAQVHFVSTLSFGINYSLEEVGKSGISQVKLFWTNDSGRTWNYFDDDPDKKSPFEGVEVSGEGVYGFIIVAKSGAGNGDEDPRPGDQPQTWIEVDVTKPNLTLSPPEVGRGPASGTLGIGWSAQDKNIAAKSIKLSYGTSSTGPWTLIREKLENTGKYQWQIPQDAPYKFYLQIEAMDRAGNVARTTTEQPVIVDNSRPRVKITGVSGSSPASGAPKSGE